MIRVVEEEHEIAQADDGVGAVARAGQILGVAVHVTDHMDPETWHAGHPKPRGAGRDRAGCGAGRGGGTCGYFRVRKCVAYCAVQTTTSCDARNIWPGPPTEPAIPVGNVRAVQ
ncbi:hypothetical protein GCM10010245_28140 [Streptomyces spectabilis]|nr:hypothetical protein GCM10010245_28140 [Streptomyces spectabilis]